MKPASNSSAGGRSAPGGDTRNQPAASTATPGTDMQPEDDGTAASGNGGHANAAESAMKQQQKTGPERGAGG